LHQQARKKTATPKFQSRYLKHALGNLREEGFISNLDSFWQGYLERRTACFTRQRN
jgi:hypothetical protein